MPAPRYVSTRAAAGGPTASFDAALLAGLAPDGGLYVPTHVPTLHGTGWDTADALPDLAARTLAPWLPAVPELGALLADALNFPVPLVALQGNGWDGVHVLELFYGPTLSFKDVGARAMARLMARALPPGETLTILAATSGDTGSAVADGFAGRDGIRVVLLYPRGQVSEVQERQLVAARDGVQALAVDGTFDDCQRLVKAAFAEPLPDGRRLSSANSINVGRLLPQTTYHAWAVRQVGRDDATVVVPSGNLGNLTAGLLSALGGLPVAGFVAAHNANRGFADFLGGGDAPSGASVRTASNAMDVGAPSNLERLRWLVPDADLRMRVEGATVTDAETLETMRELHRATGYLADPHTAVGLTAARRHRAAHGTDAPVVVLATAHPAKFPEAVLTATGVTPPEPDRLAALRDGPTRVETLPATLDALRPFLPR